MTVKAFCELYVAGCLEVERPSESAPARYRAVDDLDLSLLTPEGRRVALSLESFKSFTDLLEETGTGLAEARQELMACSGILDDALVYSPPVTSCSV